MSDSPMRQLAAALRQHGLCRFVEYFESQFPNEHLKDLVMDSVQAERRIRVGGREVVNFGSDSFLGLDQDPRVQEALRRGVAKWGTHNGASRAFASVRACTDAEEKLARWLETEACLIYPSVTLANLGAIPGLLSRQDVLVVDEQAHNSIQEGAKIAKANGVRVLPFAHCDPVALDQVLRGAAPYRLGLVALDGVYSMSGALPPLRELDVVARSRNAVLYVDDAHGTGVLGTHGRGTVLDSLGSYENALVVGSLSKAFSCLGGFLGCPRELHRLLKMRSNTWIFGGPVPPPYLEAVCTVVDLLASDEYALLRARLDHKVRLLAEGAARLGLTVLGGLTPIVSILVGDERDTLRAGKWLFDAGYYVQSVTFPAVPYHAGVLRIQVNANHPTAAVEGLLSALRELCKVIPLPAATERSHAA